MAAHAGSSASIARGTLREALGSLRNLAELLHSVRVAPKALSLVLPGVLEACAPMQSAVATLLEAVPSTVDTAAARAELSDFFALRIAELALALEAAAARPMNARSRLALEQVVMRCAFELEAARELLQLLDDAVSERSVRLDPRELVREAFSEPPTCRAEGRALVSAMLSSSQSGREIDINPRVAMTLIALGVELVGGAAGGEAPQITISSDAQGTCIVRIRSKALATGEPLVLTSRGILPPTLPCLHAAARLTGGSLEWCGSPRDFSLSYPLVSATQAG
jgi:hypothetical protein